MATHIELTDKATSAKIMVAISSIIEITGDNNGSQLQVSFQPTQRLLTVKDKYSDIKTVIAPLTP